MRTVVWTDRRGYRHRSQIRDDDPDDAAPMGILLDPPDLHRVDWEGVMKDLHNAFVDTEVSTWSDMQRKQNLQNVIFRVMKKRIITLFREE